MTPEQWQAARDRDWRHDELALGLLAEIERENAALFNRQGCTEHVKSRSPLGWHCCLVGATAIVKAGPRCRAHIPANVPPDEIIWGIIYLTPAPKPPRIKP